MRVLSIDVGIANLAICVLSLENLEKNEEDAVESAEIHYWAVLDLMDVEPDVKSAVCSAVVKRTKKPCEKKAQFSFENKTFCKTHEPHKGEEIQEKKTISKKKKRKVKTLGKHEICDRMINKLDAIRNDCNLLDVDYVLIELQPGKNQKMKAFSEMIFTYFSIRKHDQTKEDRRIKQVKFINAKNKLTIYDGPPIACKLKDKYARRKFFGVQHCKYFLEQQNEKEEIENKYLDLFLKSLKKDDLSDCYLQGLYFLKTNSSKH